MLFINYGHFLYSAQRKIPYFTRSYWSVCWTKLFFWHLFVHVYLSADRNSIVSVDIKRKQQVRRRMKKSAQRRYKHCALAVVRRSQKFSPRRIPLPGGAGRPKINQLEMVTTFTYKPSLVRIDARDFELSW